MYRDGDRLTFSPTDLITFLETEFGAWMDRWHAEDRNGASNASAEITDPDRARNLDRSLCAPDAEDETAALIQSRALEHERSYLAHLRADGHPVAEIARGARAFEQTLKAMRDGVPVIYQGRLEADDFGGHPDFLVREEGASTLGPYHYKVWDAKLAKSAKPYFIIQLCAYAELLERLQGQRPRTVEVVLGSGDRRAFSTDAYYYYYQELKRAFACFHERFDGARMPHPGLSAAYGRWSGFAERLLAESDHLSRLARITRGQIKRLEQAGVSTMTDLAQTDLAHVRGIPPAVLARLKAQAQLQIRSRGQARPLFEIMPPDSLNPRRGLALLPPASPGDVFFDMEGFPLVDGGLEYLFGATYGDDAPPSYIDWWAHDRVQEKAAFEGFIDWVCDRRRQDPTMHIYHYASYEAAAMRRLMGKYGTREAEVDDLLRHQVFVDLYTVVRQGLMIGTPGYSLKDIEPLYASPRHGLIKTAVGSVVAYQRWLDSQDAPDWKESSLLLEIRDYNRTDCQSLQRLAGWLREARRNAGISYLPVATVKEENPVEEEAGMNPSKVLAEILLRSIAEGRVTDPETRRVQELLAWLLEFHWRESKPVFWRKFERHAMTEEQLRDDFDCLGGLERTATPPIPFKRSSLYEYQYDSDQDTKLSSGSECFFAHDLAIMTKIETMDLARGLIMIKLGPKATPPERLSLIPNEYVHPKPIPQAIHRYVEAWSQGTVLSSAVDDFLHRRPPRLDGHNGGAIMPADGDFTSGVIDAVRRLSGSTLCIQGPPGTGKTYMSAAAIVALLAEGRRIGVMANSHKAVMNLMGAVTAAASTRGLKFRLAKIGGDAEDPRIQSGEIEYVEKSSDAARRLRGGVPLIGGTAWLFSRADLQGALDFLFVDEAGQVSVANIVAAGLSARNLVLVGDPMQLAQPIQGAHPGESGKSALEYLLNGHATIPPDFGIFLAETRRMHPHVGRFISEAVYESRLESHPNTLRHRVACDTVPARWVDRETGILFVPVEHEWNTQASEEETAVIEQIVGELMGRTVYGRMDTPAHPLTLEDILLVAPYNMQVRRLQQRLGLKARIGSVDRFQGLQAAVVIVSMCGSSLDECVRGIDFLLSRNRINVAVSRAESLAIIVGSPAILSARCQTIEHMELVNTYCRLAAYARSLPAGSALRGTVVT